MSHSNHTQDIFQQAAAKCRMWRSKGVHPADGQRRFWVIRFKAGVYFTLYTERGSRVHAEHTKQGESDRPVVSALALEGAMRVSTRWPREKRIQSHSGRPTRRFGGSASNHTGVTRPARLHRGLSSATLTRAPTKTAAGSLLPTWRDKGNTWKHGRKKHIRQRSTSFPAVSALGGQRIQCCTPE